jgi:hypothetical protein
LDQSKLLHALRQTIHYADEHGGIGLTQTKAFNRKFAHWAADNFDWPDYSADKIAEHPEGAERMGCAPVGVIHDVMTIAKWGRHTKGVSKLSKSLTTLNASPGKLFIALVEHFLFSYNNDRFSRSYFTAPGN